MHQVLCISKLSAVPGLRKSCISDPTSLGFLSGKFGIIFLKFIYLFERQSDRGGDNYAYFIKLLEVEGYISKLCT